MCKECNAFHEYCRKELSPPIVRNTNPYKQQLFSFRQNRYITDQTHPAGTHIYKKFKNPITRQMEEYKGVVMYFDEAEQLYTIFYSDGDKEEMDDDEIAKYLMSEKCATNCSAGEQKYANGTIIYKKFENEYTGIKQKYKGEIVDFDKTEKLYVIKYEDGDQEDMDCDEITEYIA